MKSLSENISKTRKVYKVMQNVKPNLDGNLEKWPIHESSQSVVFLKIDIPKSKVNPLKILHKKFDF